MPLIISILSATLIPQPPIPSHQQHHTHSNEKASDSVAYPPRLTNSVLLTNNTVQMANPNTHSANPPPYYHPTTNPPSLSTDRVTIHTHLLALLDRAQADPDLPAAAFDAFMTSLTIEGQMLVHEIVQEMRASWPDASGVVFPNVVALVRYRQAVSEEADRVRAVEREQAAEKARERERERALQWANSIAGRIWRVAGTVRDAGAGMARSVWGGVGRWFSWRF
jgi:hypothetical protein